MNATDKVKSLNCWDRAYGRTEHDTTVVQEFDAHELDLGELSATVTLGVEKVLDAYIDHLANPQTIKKLTAAQWNYYQALIKQGFTSEQAFQLLRDTVRAHGSR